MYTLAVGEDLVPGFLPPSLWTPRVGEASASSSSSVKRGEKKRQQRRF